jgi:hypothetical protein
VKNRRWMATAILGFLLMALAASCQGRGPAMQHFESAGVSFEYAPPLMLCQSESQGCAGCNGPSVTDAKTTPVACVGYDKKIYSHYNLSDGPALAIATLPDIHDEAKCLAFPEDELLAKPKNEQFNGITFKTAIVEDAAMSHAYRTYLYRTFRGGRCYDLELRIVTVNPGVFDSAERPKEFTAADESKVVGNFARMLNTLHLSGA